MNTFLTYHEPPQASKNKRVCEGETSSEAFCLSYNLYEQQPRTTLKATEFEISPGTLVCVRTNRMPPLLCRYYSHR